MESPGFARGWLTVLTNPENVPLRTRSLTIWISVATLVATLLIAVLSDLRFAYASPDVHVMIATAASLIGILAAGLVVAHFLRSGSLQDLALALSLIIISASNLFLSALPAALG